MHFSTKIDAIVKIKGWLDDPRYYIWTLNFQQDVSSRNEENLWLKNWISPKLNQIITKEKWWIFKNSFLSFWWAEIKKDLNFPNKRSRCPDKKNPVSLYFFWWKSMKFQCQFIKMAKTNSTSKILQKIGFFRIKMTFIIPYSLSNLYGFVCSLFISYMNICEYVMMV